MIRKDQLVVDLEIYVPVKEGRLQLQVDPTQITNKTQYRKAVVKSGITPTGLLHIHVDYEDEPGYCERPDESFLELCFLEKPVPTMKKDPWSARVRFLNLEIK